MKRLGKLNPLVKRLWTHRGVQVFFLILALVLVFLGTYCEVLDTGFYVNQVPSPILNSQVRVKQGFVVHGRLSRLDIRFGTYGKILNGRLRIRIRNAESVVFEKEFPGKIIRNNWMTSFAITPSIPAGAYSLILGFSPADQNEKLSVWLTHNDRYPHGRLTINQIVQRGDLAFRAYYRSRAFACFKMFLQRFHALPRHVILLIMALWLSLSALVLNGVLKKW